MKRKGRHPHKALKAISLNTPIAPGRYADGNGLYLVVDPSGAKRWVLRTVVHGARRDMGLGGLATVKLTEARDKAAAYRKEAREGRDPFMLKARESAPVPTFEEAAVHVHKERAGAWKNAKHAGQWINTLKEYAFPIFGSIRVDYIDSSHVLKALSPIWLAKPETARRLRQRIGVVLNWAKAARFRAAENPVIGIGEALPKQPNDKAHHAALPYSQVPAFLGELHAFPMDEGAKLAFELLILTATRTNELLQAQWPEFDHDAGVWTIPAKRMKSGKEHRIPLAPRCMEILRRSREIGHGSAFVFPGRNTHQPLSNMVFLMALRRLGKSVTAHGFRSSFRDWAAERTHFPREVCEAALAHVVENKVEAAYRRTDLFDLRKALMEAWAAFAASGQASFLKAD
jgi:integrase